MLDRAHHLAILVGSAGVMIAVTKPTGLSAASRPLAAISTRRRRRLAQPSIRAMSRSGSQTVRAARRPSVALHLSFGER